MKKIFVLSAALLMLASCAGQSEQKSVDTVTTDSTTPISQVLTGEEQARLTPDAVLESLKAGNERYVAGKPMARDLSLSPWQASRDNSQKRSSCRVSTAVCP